MNRLSVFQRIQAFETFCLVLFLGVSCYQVLLVARQRQRKEKQVTNLDACPGQGCDFHSSRRRLIDGVRTTPVRRLREFASLILKKVVQ